jgi:glutamyl-tRNA reductase
MMLRMVGWSHHRTPLHLREQLAFSVEQVAEGLQRWRAQLPGRELVLLSTCNRTELYVADQTGDGLPTADRMQNWLLDFHNLSDSDFQAAAVVLDSREAMLHLFTVAASLDSLVMGEAQIVSQVKQAYELAVANNTAGPMIHAIFQQARHVAKRVANETQIHHRRVSVPSVAISEIATEFFESFSDKRTLILGAGEMAEEAIRYLVEAQARSITVVNRTAERAEDLASRHGCSVGHWPRVDQLILDADLVVGTTSSPSPLFPVDRFRELWQNRRRGTMLILDLAVPRDFDPQVGQLPDVYLYAVDDLQEVCRSNLQLRQQEWPQAHRIVVEETDRFLADLEHRAVAPVIRRLRDQVDAIKTAELQRLLGRLGNLPLPADAEQEISQAFDRLVNKLLHPPLHSLRQESQRDQRATLLHALRRLFQLQD